MKLRMGGETTSIGKDLLIQGVVIEKETGKGIPNLWVKAVDKDLLFDDLLGSVTTDAEGKFKIKYNQEDFKDRFLEKKPDIHLDIKTPEAALIHSTRDKIRFDAKEIEEFIIKIPKITKPKKPKGKIYAIKGKIIQKGTERGLKNVRVKAFDKDIFKDDLLGSVPTDENGNFKMQFEEKDFQELFLDKNPDIYFKIISLSGMVIETTETIPDVKDGNVDDFNIEVSLPWNLEIIEIYKQNGWSTSKPIDAATPYLKCTSNFSPELTKNGELMPLGSESEVTVVVLNGGNAPSYNTYVEVYEGPYYYTNPLSDYHKRDYKIVTIQPGQQLDVKLKYKREFRSAKIVGICYDPLFDQKDFTLVEQYNRHITSLHYRERRD